MKKLIRNIALCLIPVVVYFGIFVIFEPNNYFGLKKEAVSDDIIARLHDYKTNPANNVIIGESRFVKFDMGLAKKASGKDFCNLSFGGGSFDEMLDLADWVLEQNPNVETIVMGASFYTFNRAYSHNRMIPEAMNNPLRYITNLTYNINMMEQVYLHLYNVFNPSNKVELGGDNETKNPDDYIFKDVQVPKSNRTVNMREDLATFSLEFLSQRTDNWSLNTQVVDRIYALQNKCNEKNVNLIIVFSPMDESVRTLVIEPMEIAPIMENCINEMRNSGISIIDYEFENPPNFSNDLFFDGFHMDSERGIPIFTKLMFGDIKELLENAS